MPNGSFRLLHRLAAPTLLASLVSCGGSAEAPVASEGSGDSRARPPVIADVLNDFSGVEEKILGLADAFEQSEYDWRPGEGVRSGAEVFMHVTTINFAFPLFAGHEAPASTGLTLETLPTSAPALEGSSQVKAEILDGVFGEADERTPRRARACAARARAAGPRAFRRVRRSRPGTPRPS